jgi:hypothetical protein
MSFVGNDEYNITHEDYIVVTFVLLIPQDIFNGIHLT